jgi:hypothetical protein
MLHIEVLFLSFQSNEKFIHKFLRELHFQSIVREDYSLPRYDAMFIYD